MTALSLSQSRIREGAWEAVVAAEDTAAPTPRFIVTHLDKPLGYAEVVARPTAPGTWAVRFAIPPGTLSDGVQSFLVTEATSGDKIADFAILAGEALGDDIRAEIALVRAELDMLKHAFRRHCVETG